MWKLCADLLGTRVAGRPPRKHTAQSDHAPHVRPGRRAPLRSRDPPLQGAQPVSGRRPARVGARRQSRRLQGSRQALGVRRRAPGVDDAVRALRRAHDRNASPGIATRAERMAHEPGGRTAPRKPAHRSVAQTQGGVSVALRGRAAARRWRRTCRPSAAVGEDDLHAHVIADAANHRAHGQRFGPARKRPWRRRGSTRRRRLQIAFAA